MKAKLLIALVGTVLALPLPAAPFVNFTFDEGPLDIGALVDGGPTGLFHGPSSNILPGWEAQYLGKPVDLVGYSVPGRLGHYGPLTVWDYGLIAARPEGAGRNLLALIVNGDQMTDPAFVDLVLRQRGEIPADAVSLGLFNGGHGEVRIDGKTIGIFSSAVGGPVFDISAYAGKEVMLEFAFYRGQSPIFDNLGFVTVPEPSTWALVGVGALALWWASRRK